MRLLYLEEMRLKQNLLAFSGGVDSSALFFLLLEAGIAFDVAMVDYGVRLEREREIAYAKELCARYGKELFIHTAPTIATNFEHTARNVRYEFFTRVCEERGYHNVVMAHQLDDRLEWFLMQLCKGSGILGLGGLRGISQWRGIRIIRPLIESSRKEIYEYLHTHKYTFFEDSSNADTRFVRNFFRHNVVRTLMPRFAKGVARSFRILEQESMGVFPQIYEVLPGIFVIRRVCANEVWRDCYAIDYALKQFGYVMSAKQREELVKSGFCCHIAQNYVVDSNTDFIFVARAVPTIPMPKCCKEQYRLAKIPSKIRPILFQNAIVDSKLEAFMRNLEGFK
ncbi:tRNA lysidine(34) synthetase TilS [uncultured Helicobacter sp.]|uniref:tRNA lysidine(34) synthetase TilS n=1 Tax=uncultured Helicobacter sp. TaxID=175537 RepID=UPI00374F9179